MYYSTQELLRSESSSKSVLASVKDNGAGFNMTEAVTGYGLGNMRRRAEEMGGAFSMTSAEGAGADVRVSLPFAI